MNDLDARLARGPLRVQSVWSPGSPERLTRHILRRRRLFFGLDAVAVCACLALVSFLSLQRASRPSSGDAGVTASAAIVAGKMTAFTVDGSLAETTSRDTQLVVEQDTPERVVSRLTGGARFHVVPNHERTFEVRAGDVRVRVLGTVFSVQQLPAGLTQVLVERGRVEVAWLGGSTLLESGQGGTFPPPPSAEAEPDVSGGAVVSTEPMAPPASRAPGGAHDRPSSGAGWRESAHAGD